MVGWELEGAVGETVGDAWGDVVAFVVRLVAHEVHDAVEALDAEALDFVSGCLGGGLDPSDAAEEFRHDAAHDIAALSVGSVGGRGNGFDGVEGDLLK